MLKTRHEKYESFEEGLPFLFHLDLNRSRINCSAESNWHENIEIQICDEGEGFVLLNSERYEIIKNDVVAVNPNVIHYTGTNTNMTYSCLIISTEFCKSIGIDTKVINFLPVIRSPRISDLFSRLKKIHVESSDVFRTAKLNKLLIELLIELGESHCTLAKTSTRNKRVDEIIKLSVSYMQDNFARKITLDELAKAVLYDKYALCREFKKYTAQTVMEYLNSYRCTKAAEYLSDGYSVSSVAELCGFDNLSYFSRTFKKYIGMLPSKYRKG